MFNHMSKRTQFVTIFLALAMIVLVMRLSEMVLLILNH